MNPTSSAYHMFAVGNFTGAEEQGNFTVAGGGTQGNSNVWSMQKGYIHAFAHSSSTCRV